MPTQTGHFWEGGVIVEKLESERKRSIRRHTGGWPWRVNMGASLTRLSTIFRQCAETTLNVGAVGVIQQLKCFRIPMIPSGEVNFTGDGDQVTDASFRQPCELAKAGTEQGTTVVTDLVGTCCSKDDISQRMNNGGEPPHMIGGVQKVPRAYIKRVRWACRIVLGEGCLVDEVHRQ